MSTREQLQAMSAEIESHLENLRQLRRQAVIDDADEVVLGHYAEAIQWGGWMAQDIRKIVALDESEWPESGPTSAYGYVCRCSVCGREQRTGGNPLYEGWPECHERTMVLVEKERFTADMNEALDKWPEPNGSRLEGGRIVPTTR